MDNGSRQIAVIGQKDHLPQCGHFKSLGPPTLIGRNDRTKKFTATVEIHYFVVIAAVIMTMAMYFFCMLNSSFSPTHPFRSKMVISKLISLQYPSLP